MKTYDVAVVGLGAMGAAALYQLSKQNINVIGIDKYSPPHAYGSSTGETRVTRQAIGEGIFYTPMVLRANEIWAELEAASGRELYDHSGMLIAAHEEQQFLQNTLQAANKYHIQHEIFDGKEAERRFPALDFSEKEHTFYYEPTSGYLRPEVCIDVELKLAKSNGAELLLNTEVASIQETTQGVEITLDDEQIMAQKVIVASGPWVKEMLPETLGPILKTLLQTLYWFDIDPAYYEQLKLGSFPVFLCGGDKSQITRSFYGFPIIGGPNDGMKFAVHETTKEVRPADKDTASPVTSAQEIYRFISRYVRGLQPNSVKSVNCLYTVTPDKNFIIDFVPDSKRMVVVSACSGHGFKHSAAVGEMAGELILGRKTILDNSPFALSRFN